MEGKPKEVREAQLNGDTETLSEMGHNGAEGKARSKTIAKKRLLNMHAKSMVEKMREANEHIVTPDGDDGEFPDGIIRAA